MTTSCHRTFTFARDWQMRKLLGVFICVLFRLHLYFMDCTCLRCVTIATARRPQHSDTCFQHYILLTAGCSKTGSGAAFPWSGDTAAPVHGGDAPHVPSVTTSSAAVG